MLWSLLFATPPLATPPLAPPPPHGLALADGAGRAAEPAARGRLRTHRAAGPGRPGSETRRSSQLEPDTNPPPALAGSRRPRSARLARRRRRVARDPR